MPDPCTHLDQVDASAAPSSTGCEDCLASGGTWLHLRMCLSCGHVGCCDSSPNKHATSHFRASAHSLMQSFEPGEEWVWCSTDEITFLIDGVPSRQHP